MKIVVSIPAFNESETISKVLMEIKEVMHKSNYNFDILVVDDGSKDETAKLAKEAGAIVYSHPYNHGLAKAFKTEIQESLKLDADLIVHTDADGQYLAKDIPRLIEEIKEGYDLVLGNRFTGGIEKMPFLKKLGNKAFSKAISKIIKFKVGDCQTGFRAFTRKVAEEIEIVSDHTYTQEQIIKSVRQGFKIKEIPTYFAERIGGRSRLMKNPFQYAFNAWKNIIRIYRDYEPLRFFGRIGLLFFTLGFLIGLWLTVLFFITGKVEHTSTVILGTLLMLTGIQIVLFGFLADMRKK
ncbi:MAG: glycosyltransferase family 2 protein [Candidatus Woesearchaeota archaeon]